MPPVPKSILNRIKQLAASSEAQDLAISRAEQLSPQVDLSRYSPSAIARSTLLQPAAQRGFSESIVSTQPPFASLLMRPSEFLSRTPPLDTPRDAAILRQLAPSIQKDKLKDLPLLWTEEYPDLIETGYEGRHRMRSLQDLYGDDPVLMNVVQGDRYNLTTSPYYPGSVRTYEGPSQLSPLQLIQREIQFGDRPFRINPLWMEE